MAKKKAQTSAAPAPPAVPSASQHSDWPILLLVCVHTLSKLAILAAAAGTAVLSFLAGASPLMLVARTGSAILVVGLAFWGLNWLVTQGAVPAVPVPAEAAPPAPRLEMEA